MWVKPNGCEDGASGERCVNAVKAETHHEELIRLFKNHAEKYLSHLRDAGFEQGDWVWEARMAESCILLPLDASVTIREVGKEILRRMSKGSTLEAGLELLCSSEASAAAITRGLHHALRHLLPWPLNRCSRGLQQLFFHVWKLLTLNDKEPDRPTNLSQGNQNGGFLTQPNFQHLSLDNSHATSINKVHKNEAAWRKLCTVISGQLWPLLVKTIVEGKLHLEGAGQLMTFTRMLQLLPCVFRNLNAAQKKTIFQGKSRSKYFSRYDDGSDLPWFYAFIKWSDVPSPIIQRWWKEAVGSILEDLKAWELVLPSELDEVVLDFRTPGLQFDEQRRLRLPTLLLSIPDLVLSHQFLDRAVDTIPLENMNVEDGQQRWKADDPDCIVLDGPQSAKDRWPPNDVIYLPDSPEPSLSAPVHPLHGDDEPLSTSQKQVGFDLGQVSSHRNVSDRGSGSEKAHFDWPQSHRPPPERQAPVSSQRKVSATLDKFLAKFYSGRAERETNNKGGLHVKGSRSIPSKPPPAAKGVSVKPHKPGGKLSSLRNEHREVLEQRSAVEGFVRNQVRERVESEARSKQSAPAECRSTEKYLKPISAPDFDAELRELVQGNEVDPLDAALDTARKPRHAGLTEPGLKPKRKLITLEMPGETVKGSSLLRPKPGLIINPRQIPRLDIWYKEILSLDYFSVVGVSDDSPGKILGERLEKVPVTFKSPELYMKIFQPLVLEEFKSQLQRSHGELNMSDGTTTGVLRLMSLERVDEFQVGRFVAEAGSDGAARACADNEMLLLSRQPFQSRPQSCHVLAKVESRDRESKSRATVLLMKLFVPVGDVRLAKAKRLLVDRSKWYMTRIMNITPQIREWQALSSISSLPLLPILLSPMPGYQMKGSEGISSITKLRCLPEPLQSTLRGDHNESQLRAIAAAIGGKETMINDHQLALIQGPPGTGKTKTIVAILSALLALRSSKRISPRGGIENQPPPSRINTAIKSSSRDAAALSRAWQDAARAKDIMKDGEIHSADFQGQKQRVLVCAQSNAAVDEIVARICKNGLYGVNGQFFKPSVVRIGAMKSVHPKSLPVFIDTLVDRRFGSEKGSSDDQAADDQEQTKVAACRSKLEEVIEFIQVIESLRSQSADIEGDKIGQKAGLSQSVFGDKALKVIALGESAVTGKLNLLYNQRRALTAEVATAEKEGKKAYEESKNLRKAIRKDIIRQADVVVTTLSGCGGDIYSVCMESVAAGGKKGKPVQECFFDAVVIDEAAQALEPATLIPLQLLVQTNARCVMVGDPKQLPATVLSQMATRMQYECSMFERLQRGGFPVTMLSTQYRMHPEIRQFPSAHFYDDRIIDGEGLEATRKAIFHRESNFGPYVFFDVVDGQESSKGSSASQSLSNGAEVAVAVQLYLSLKKRYPAELWEGRVGVITPYKQQLRLLQEEFGRACGSAAASEIEFNTVDGFQGREVDILILTTVRASSSSLSGNSKPVEIGFVADVRRMNVALTRARFSMWIIGNAATLRSNSSWASLLSNAESRALIYSVQKPYASFFQKSRPRDTSHSTGAHKNSKVRESGAALEVAAREAKDSRVGFKERVDFRVQEERNDVLIKNGDNKARDLKMSRESTPRSSSIHNGKAREVRVETTHVSREYTCDRDEGRPKTEMRRNPTREDTSRESSCRRPEGRSSRETRSHSGVELSLERSGNMNGDRSITETKRDSSGRVLSGESHRGRNERRNGTGEDKVRVEGAHQGRNLEEKRHQDERAGSKQKLAQWSQQETRQDNSEKDNASEQRHLRDSSRANPKERKSLVRNREEQSFGERRHTVERDRSNADRSDRENGADDGHNSRQSSQRHTPVSLKDGDERKHADLSRVNRHENFIEAGLIVPQAGQREVVSEGSRLTGSRNMRTSQEELNAARKRKREEVAALLPSALLMSSERRTPSVPQGQRLSTAAANVHPAPEQPSQLSPVEVSRDRQKGMNDEWARFQAALGEVKTAISVTPTADCTPRVPNRLPKKPVQDLRRSVSKLSKPSSDLDNILSGLSSVTWAQAKGGKLDALPKSKA